ncbi:hypothetical protein [Microbacterium sp. 2MCAF23]|uniref:hypothetical protein n=1 Tax=Microbacterium sp. 2MCAF23 TaxID=3232985 RepID=UPI003F9E9F88
MPKTSPAGHPIGLIDGDSGVIARRANEIETRGTQMQHAVTVLQRLVDSGITGQGQAVQSLIDDAGLVIGDLRQAAELYRAVVGPLRNYAQFLMWEQSEMRPILDDLTELWAAYNLKREVAMTAGLQSPDYPTGADSGDAALRQAAEDKQREAFHAATAAADAARTAWENRARAYDVQWDLWHGNWTRTAAAIGRAEQGKIHDTPDDDLRGGLSAAQDRFSATALLTSFIPGGQPVSIGSSILGAGVAWTRFARRDTNDVSEPILATIGILPLIGPTIRSVGESLTMGRVVIVGGESSAKDITTRVVQKIYQANADHPGDALATGFAGVSALVGAGKDIATGMWNRLANPRRRSEDPLR